MLKDIGLVLITIDDYQLGYEIKKNNIKRIYRKDLG